MRYLVDANVLSEPTKPHPNSTAVEWLRLYEAELAMSPIVLGELHFGILLLPSGQKRTRLLRWFVEGAARLPVLDFDAATADVWAKLLSRLRKKGQAIPIKDSLIAATAQQHGLSVATRNVVDFKNAGVEVVDPFEEGR